MLSALLIGCATPSSKDATQSSSADQTILGKTWYWYKTVTPAETLTVKQPEQYSLLLATNGRAQVQFDCNSGGGNYKIRDKELSFGPMMSTRMACLGDSLGRVYGLSLQKVHAFNFDAGNGDLKLMFDGGDMYFRAQP